MILLLWTCSTSWCQSNFPDSIPLTGEEMHIDSVLVPISALKVANAKMIELKYEKEINEQLRGLIQTDSNIIDALSTNLTACEMNTEIKVAEIKKQRNIAIGAGAGTSLIFLILLILSL